ncbi:uncharacterized protein DDB_G0283357 [Planococcus citri]|uniref:uncharacterized protein DDB_G0283357 n=1 Tax=Planococcus citri TaxID=170843 RepID=UPI0031FA1F51
MEKVLKRVTHHNSKKQQQQQNNTKSSSKNNAHRSSSINKRYSVDDNFYTYVHRGELYENCGSTASYFTIANRGEFKRSTMQHRSRSSKEDTDKHHPHQQQITRNEDVTFKKFLKVFNSSSGDSKGAKEWFASGASNMMDFAPRILTKRFCGKKSGDNELYRSNSFKFERFERKDNDTLTSSKKSPVSRQISLCDDYSLPVDFVNKRPLSLDSGSFWSAPSPNGDQVEVLNLYCDPKDSKSQQNLNQEVKDEVEDDDNENVKLYTIPDKEYSRPYTDTSEDDEHEDDEPELYENLKHRSKHTALAKSARPSSASSKTSLSNTYTEVRKSPYYYGDLLKRSQSEDQHHPDRRYDPNSYRKCQSLDVSHASSKRCSGDGSGTGGASGSASKELKYRSATAAGIGETAAAVANSFDIQEENEEEDDEDDDMTTKQRHLYETAFDSKICRSNETLDLDEVTNHVLERRSPQTPYNPTYYNIPADRKCSLKRLTGSSKSAASNQKSDASIDNLSQHLTDLDLADQTTLLRGYSSASTSTIPLPQSASSNLNDSFDSFSESSHKTGGAENFRNEVVSHHRRRVKESSKTSSCCNNNNSTNSINNNHNYHHNRNHHSGGGHHHHHHNSSRQSSRHYKHRISLCCRTDDTSYISDSATTNDSRPKSCHISSSGSAGASMATKILEIKSRPRCVGKFSSTESMATSSSGGSLESIRSSTSEGNRSTTSTDSHHSSSLSSHSSDSAVGTGAYHYPAGLQLGNRFLNQNKMHVLSPISDKSFQEAGSESSEINRNTTTTTKSPDAADVVVKRPNSPSEQQQQRTTDGHKSSKRSLPQNKNVASLSLPFSTNNAHPHPPSSSAAAGDTEVHHGSDSGISIESRSDTNKMMQNNDLNDLPFDMPKLRRRRLQQMQLTQSSTQDTSSSATSVDLKDLPFDMPKLRRKMRSSSTQDSVEVPDIMNNAASIGSLTNHDDHSGDEGCRQAPNLDVGRNRKSLGLSLNLNEIINVASNIDADVPLERQGWYHGAITRMEAENELRNREEGSYLVRNSESAKNDYSLSLKSAKGFMHMRIQKSSETNKFILGQFSSPFDSIPQMIKHYSSNQLPIRGAEHMCLLQPVIAQLL